MADSKARQPPLCTGSIGLVCLGGPASFSLATRFGPEEFEVATAPVFPSSDIAPVRNVVLFVFESLAARYVGAYGAGYGATHTSITGRPGAVFANAYTHAPATNKMLFSTFSSLYPWISFHSETANTR